MNRNTDTFLAGRETFLATIYAAALLWINAYICRDLFRASTTYMNSMHGFWTAIAKLGGDGWFHPAWWPYWDCGIPFEYLRAAGAGHGRGLGGDSRAGIAALPVHHVCGAECAGGVRGGGLRRYGRGRA
jgi:hypothetical protein